MPTNTNKQTQPQTDSFQPGISKHEPWDDISGSPTHYDNETKGNHDNGGSFSDTKDNYDNGSNYIARNNSAVDTFRNAENTAASSREPSYYRGNGTKAENDNSQSKAKSKKKGIGAIITIALILAGGGAFLGASNSLLAPAISALMTSSTQTSYTSYTLRTKYIMKGMMNDAGGTVTTSWTGSKKYSKIPTYMKNRLAKYGFEVEGSGKNTRFSWTHTTASGGTETISGIDAQEFLNMFNDNVEFRTEFMKAKRGRVATFFDNVAEKIYRKLGISRNVFNDYKQTGDAEVDNKSWRSKMESVFDKGRTTIRTNAEGEAVDQNGNPIYETDSKGNLIYDDNGNPIPVRDEINSSGTATSGSATDEIDANAKASGMVADISNKVAQVGSVACTFARIGSSIALSAAAMEIYQSIDYFMTQLEPISKMKSELGESSPINALLNFLTTPYTTKVEDYASTSVSYSNGEQTIPTQEQSGAATEGAGFLAMTADATGPQAISRTKNYSIERIIISMGGASIVGAKASEVCEGVDITQSIVSIGTAIATGGASIIAGFFTDLFKNLAIQISVSTALSFIIPSVAKILFSNAFNITNGIPAGEMLARGAAAANMRNGRSGSGQSPSSKDVVLAFNQSTNQVLALEAEQDRATLSPFDTSNRNTFFGSIAYSLLPTITSTNLTGLSSFLRSTASSLSSIISRGVSADGEGSSYLTTFGNCPMLDQIGAVGDMYCNPIVTTDMSTIELEPDDEEYNKVIADSMESCDEEGNCKIKEDSDLAKYITFCDGRDSPFGAVDQNILGALEIGNFFLNSIPVVSDVIGIIDAGIHLTNMAWATGANCVNTSGSSIGANTYADNNSFWNTKGKYYQRYIEDQRILEQMGAYEGSKNPVIAYEEAYEAKHPTDNSYIGYLSRISGLTPENTETVLAFVTYYDFVNQYDPTLRIAMQSGDTTEIKSGEEVIATILNQQLLFSDHNLVHSPIETNSPVREHIVYFDLRNRSYIA